MSSIKIVSAKAAWRKDFETLKLALSKVAPSGSRLHHIGSTAVPGLAAKDVVDVQMTVESLDRVDDAALAATGFRRRPGLVDHCPLGLHLTTGICRNDSIITSVEPRTCTFARQAASISVTRCSAATFSDRIKVPPTLTPWSRRALRSASPNDPSAYYEIKDPIFDIIMAGANEWAARIGWREPPAD